ncbi:hypothetical protein jhhlp_003532 [Lomentospora prolificans]|uniref:Restriction endonuclease type IV Mrr domain-containing protein n=1 Tax=Lomentospora prolificans TaxID=41688 RepID=A0A2N3N903_9PEZI|nr:hypothetical protein jhhlp_003532 [Lomentospora prolificans]
MKPPFTQIHGFGRSCLTLSRQPLRRISSIVPRRKAIFPDASSSSHSDLQSFLKYAQKSGLNPKSTVYVGTHYEYTVAASLAQYGFSLKRVGGASDFGIDLLGSWAFPSSAEPLKTLVQCKAGAIGPHTIRELEGAFVGAPVGWRGPGVLGILASRKVATKGVADALARSRWPMIFFCCSTDGIISQARWNHRAEQEGLEGLHAALLRSGDKAESRIVLTWKGKGLPAATSPRSDEADR